jgi:Ca2+-binding RTX toxin-like protein
MKRGAGRAAVVGVVTGAVLVVAPDAASAGPPGGTVEVGFDGNFDFDGEPGVVNQVVVTKVGTTLTLDDVHTVEIIRGCSYPDAADDTVVQCTVAPAAPDVHVEPGDMNDTVTVVGGGSVNWLIGPGPGNDRVDMTGVDGGGASVAGGTGDDTITGSPYGEAVDGDDGFDTISYAGRAASVSVDLAAGDGGTGTEHDDLTAVEAATGGNGDDTLTGDAGMNVLAGGPGDDVLSGAGEADTLVGGTGTDQMLGGAGSDLASYAGHAQGVTASLNGVADDGAPGENDLVGADVERLAGGLQSDTLTGNASTNTLYGDVLPPNGLLYPLWYGSADVITTNGGGDTVYARGGDDTVIGASGVDVVHGGYGNDVVHGGNNGDGLYGDQGGDTLYGDAGQDALDGGADNDWCYAGADGAVKTACELPLVFVP